MKPILIVIAGWSASGKTTVVEKIVANLNSNEVTVIKHDDYYKDLTHLPIDERTVIVSPLSGFGSILSYLTLPVSS